LAVTRREVACKERMAVLAPTGTRTTPVPRLMRHEPALAKEHVSALAHLGLTIEQWMGRPVDVECA
jgi:phosphoenolpyruvate synthase/pyruvate phosphate dikinase